MVSCGFITAISDRPPTLLTMCAWSVPPTTQTSRLWRFEPVVRAQDQVQNRRQRLRVGRRTSRHDDNQRRVPRHAEARPALLLADSVGVTVLKDRADKRPCSPVPKHDLVAGVVQKDHRRQTSACIYTDSPPRNQSVTKTVGSPRALAIGSTAHSSCDTTNVGATSPSTRTALVTVSQIGLSSGRPRSIVGSTFRGF